MAKKNVKKTKINLGVREIIFLGCVALWLVVVYGQIKEDLEIAHQKHIPYRFMDSLDSITGMLIVVLIGFIIFLGFAGIFKKRPSENDAYLDDDDDSLDYSD